MPSEAGDRDYYIVNGKRYPRVTSVIKDTMAKPALMRWTYMHTRDTISGLVSVLGELAPHERIIDMLTDVEMLEEYLKENQLRPDDVSLEAAVIGTERHALMETLGSLGIRSPQRSFRRAEWVLANSGDGHERAIADWWLTRRPQVMASELRLPSDEYIYCGTVDLVWRDEYGRINLTDLKNRKADPECGVAHRTPEAADRCHVGHAYESDEVQVGAYQIAWDEKAAYDYIDRRTVLIAKADGRWVEDEATLDSSIFLDYLSAWKKLKGVVK